MRGKARTPGEPSSLFTEGTSSRQDSKVENRVNPISSITTMSRDERRIPGCIEHLKGYDADHEEYKGKRTTHHVSRAPTTLDDSEDSTDH